MAYQFETIEVRISRRTLWIGSQIFPLQNVVRVQSREEVRDRGGLIWRFVKKAARTLGLGLALLALVASAAPTQVGLLLIALAGIVGVLGWQSYEFSKDVSRGTLFFLVIETASATITAIASQSRIIIADLVDKITEAIDNPAVDYAVKIDIVEGDQFNQNGGVNTMSFP